MSTILRQTKNIAKVYKTSYEYVEMEVIGGEHEGWLGYKESTCLFPTPPKVGDCFLITHTLETIDSDITVKQNKGTKKYGGLLRC